MFVKINEAVREYHVAFEQDRSKRFEKGPNKGRPQTVTDCKIWLLPGPTLVGKGDTVLGCKDKADSVEACKHALSRALADAKLGKEANTLFWEEFHKRHRRVTCQHKVVAKGNGTDWCTERSRECRQERCGGPVHGYGGLYSHQRRAMMATGHVPSASYIYRRHEFRDVETVLPRTEAEKREQYRKLYGGDGTHPVRTGLRRRHNNITVVNTDQLKDLLHNNSKRVRDILEDGKKKQWMRGTWAVADERLTARMKAMSQIAAEEFARVDAELVSRPGITKVGNEYIVAVNFVPRFEAGDIVMCENRTAKVLEVNGVILKIQPVILAFGLHAAKFGGTKTVMDWEVKPVTHWPLLRRVWKRVRSKPKEVLPY